MLKYLLSLVVIFATSAITFGGVHLITSIQNPVLAFLAAIVVVFIVALELAFSAMLTVIWSEDDLI